MIELVIPIVFMLCVVLGEALLLQRRNRGSVDWHDVIFNLNSGHIMLWLFRGLEIACYGYVVTHYNQGWLSDWPAAAVWLFTLLAWDFGFYWLHRLHHRFRLLWAVHVVHHQGENFNLSLGVRNSWYSSLTSIPFFMLLALAGVPLAVFITVSILHYGIQLFNHNALTPRLGFLEKILVTPAHHRVHHVNDLAYSNRNFGGSFIFWDKLFGTFGPALPTEPFAYGVRGDKSSVNPFWASNLPFLRYFRLPFQPSAKAARFHCAAGCMVSGTLLLFALVLGYVYRYGYGYDGLVAEQAALFVLLALGAMALGGMAEGRYWGVGVWFAVALAFPLLLVLLLAWHQPYWLMVSGMIALHGSAVAVGWGRRLPRLSEEKTHG
ncbi:fatty acid hydroxylase [Chania multitudinisentens RB-25]|uniref:Fatty acid hydroxylase n=1 Tax=Chania multitudinisentens RB-25 TaxID=1441930 RepID=W0LI35_9GAMM|nr:sterol desaturase family protein [Chania multitudinisentens]AHG22109.1 fatty acid hydroxylase [Chania multitudinisentens RB-25]